MRKWWNAIKVSLVSLMAAVAFAPTSALAHDPLILTPEQDTPERGPLLPDGTISFALYGSLDAPGETRGFRVTFDEGDPLYLSILIPDLEPENALADADLPYLEVEDPTGSVSTLTLKKKVPFKERFTGTNYVELVEFEGKAVKGTYSITIRGSSPTRFTVAVGVKEQFGTEVENAPNRNLGVAGVKEWYEQRAGGGAPSTTDVDAVGNDESRVGQAETHSDGASVFSILAGVVVACAILVVVAIVRRRQRTASDNERAVGE